MTEITAPLIKTEAEMSMVLNALRVERERYAKLAVLMTSRNNKERYAGLVAGLDALYQSITDRKAEADNFNPMDEDPVEREAKILSRRADGDDRVEIDPCTGHGESW